MTAAANPSTPSKSGSRRANALPSHHLLDEYRIDAILGAGGFGVTYKAFDTHLENWVAIKEYFPIEWSFRAADGVTVCANTQGQTNAIAGQLSDYEWGLERFLDEARVLARVQHPYVVRVKRYFRGHGTAYIVMDYEEGEPLSAILREGETLGEAQIRGLLEDVLPALQAVHEQGYLHRDIKPSNLYVRAHDHRVILIDFGAARAAISRHSQSVSSLVTPGYSPPEQYSTRNDRYGPWTDIYALGAVLYRCITGQTPVEAADRLLEDTLKPAVAVGAGRYSTNLLRVIDRALAVRPDQRFCDVIEIQAGLSSAQDENGDETVIMVPFSKSNKLPAQDSLALRAVLENTGRVRRETTQPLTVGSRLFGRPLLSEEPPPKNAFMSRRRLWGALSGVVGVTAIAAIVVGLWPSAPVQEAKPPSSSLQSSSQRREQRTETTSPPTPSASAAVETPSPAPTPSPDIAPRPPVAEASPVVTEPTAPPAAAEIPAADTGASAAASPAAQAATEPAPLSPVTESASATTSASGSELDKPASREAASPTDSDNRTKQPAVSAPVPIPPTPAISHSVTAPAAASARTKAPSGGKTERVMEKRDDDGKKPVVRNIAETPPKAVRQKPRRARAQSQPIVAEPVAPARSVPVRPALRHDNPWDSPTSTGFNQK